MERPPIDTIFTVVDVAARYQRHPKTIRKWVRAGDMPHRRFGANRRLIGFTADDLAAFDNANATPMHRAEAPGRGTMDSGARFRDRVRAGRQHSTEARS